jgi:phosphoesterase RecJ-like protein
MYKKQTNAHNTYLCFMISQQLGQLTQWLASPAKIIIIPHKNPDGDAMGSSLGWQNILKQMGHEVVVVAPNAYPTFLHWLPGHECVLYFDKNTDQAVNLIANADLIFTLDFNTLARIGVMGEHVAQSKAKKIMIDHHQEPEDYADLCFSKPTISSTCELVYELIEALDLKAKINKDIASCLYTGMLTDTGSFRFASVTEDTHRAVAHLLSTGIKHHEIHERILGNKRPERLKLLGVALGNMVIVPDKKTAYITLSQEELDSCDYQKGDSEGLVNYALSVAGVSIAVLMMEHREEEIIKLSFRSKGDLAVNQFAKQHFEGGGHINAAGGKSLRSLKETERYFLEALDAFFSSL